MDELKKCREEINDIDNKMAELFYRRMKTVERVAEYKRRFGIPIFDPTREEQVLLNGADRIDDQKICSHYMSFLKETMEISKKYQNEIISGLKVAYCGTEGAFAYIAADKIFPRGEKVAYKSFSDAYNSVVNGECECVVLPVENSMAGDVGQVMDLMFSGTLFVNGMYDLSVNHNLLAVKGANASKIKTVVSHPQALMQCSEYIEKNSLKEVQYSNTALAAEYVSKQNDMTLAAIGSTETAKKFGLEVVAKNINDSLMNTTHFAVLSRVDSKSSANKDDAHFSLVFTARNEAGALAEAISVIGKYGFNMRTLRSRPMKELLWQYYFYIEATGDIYGEKGKKCLKELEKFCDKVKVLGSYTTVFEQED